MESYLVDWLNLLLRWLHVIAAIAWIGESIYFVMLDNSLHPPKNEEKKKLGMFGEMWAVHGGGFYNNQKYLTNPPELPADLHWSFWKSYVTWLSGFALFTVIYLANPSFYLTNPASAWPWAASLSGGAANVVAIAFLGGGWLVYDQLCRRISPNMERDGPLSFVVALMMIGVAYAASHVFQGRAAFLITGAVMATCMSANVFFWIIPGQRRMVADLRAGRAPNPLDGKRGKQRSVHNTYFTLPVVFLMISNHYAFTFGSAHAWIVMSLFIVAGALIRQYFVLRHSGRNVVALPAAGVVLLAINAWVATLPAAPVAATPAVAAAPAAAPIAAAAAAAGTPTAAAGGEAGFDRVKAVLDARCVSCHAAQPTQPGFSAPPAGVKLDNPHDIAAAAARIKKAVATNYMPLGNMTKMTPEERQLIADWTGQGQ
ncbi:urate hydroxylase PuuD [Chitinimonas koreensis]|uniref:urate hydroxylase PuuD n=1 Tax=Chitinimonas koreensis TaxID=356302 RepID=UPI00041365F7|nr:urate hydroxylase PuuD [Chitinimonas koreensis]QNM94818.1 urate hydroxylase PuuD [Chitinimonas koreensis]